MGKKAFIHQNIYIENEGIRTCDLTFGERILSVGYADGDAEILDLPEGAVVVPGLIDEHVHGAGGCDAMDGSVRSLETIAATLAAEGTTRFLATTMTQNGSEICAALKAVDEYAKRKGSAVIGVHLEGPFISRKYAGAQSPDCVMQPDVAVFEKWNALSGNRVKMVTLAPEERGGQELITYLSRRGVSASVGHSAAGYDVMCEAVARGLDCVTHTYNAQRGLHHRDVGVTGSALLVDRLYCELIADGIHVSPPAVRLLTKCKPKDRLILITDAIRAKGTEEEISSLGGQTVYVRDGQARLADGTLAGSVLKMNDAVTNLVRFAGVSLTQAIDCATANPAAHLGIGKDFGGIQKDKVADFAVLYEGGVLMTLRDGEIVYRAS